MKKILKRLSIFFLCTIFIFNTCIATVYAGENERPSGGYQEPTIEEPDEALWSKLSRSAFDIFYVLLAQAGCLADKGSFEDYVKNHNDFTQAIDNVWTKENVKVKTDSNGKKSLVFSKVVADTLLKGLKDANKKPEYGGYELIPTVPVNKVSALYFHNSADYRSMYELLKANNGLMGLYYSGHNAFYYKLEPNTYYVRGNLNSLNNKYFRAIRIYKNINDSPITYTPYYLAKVDEAVSSWNDTEKLHRSTAATLNQLEFFLYDYYSAYTSHYSGNPLSSRPFIVSSTGVSVPVFNTLKDLVAYSVANNLYYTTSDYTGEGAEVTIDYDELDKILSGYYSGMYDMLQRLIEQNGGNALTPEQVQALADQVAESFDMLKAEINKGFEEQDKLIQANSNILKAIKSIMEKGFEDINKALDGILKKLENLKVDTGGSVGGLIVGGIDILLDLAEFIKDFVVDTEKGVATLATGFTDIVGLMSKKFPFSIPWDISIFIARFAHAPEAPVFEIPVILPRYGIDEKFVIDFSDFEIISKISRSILSVLYAISLIKFTDKVISTKKGGVV